MLALTALQRVSGLKMVLRVLDQIHLKLYIIMAYSCSLCQSKNRYNFIILARFQNFKDWRSRDAHALLVVLFLERYDTWIRI